MYFLIIFGDLGVRIGYRLVVVEFYRCFVYRFLLCCCVVFKGIEIWDLDSKGGLGEVGRS